MLASVPGTPQAAEAVLLAQVPQTARVNKKEIKAPDVAYQGDPKFEPIEKTSLSRAVNTDKDIVKVGDLYYMCFQGVWFVSSSPQGPWEVTSSVPQTIYEIPVSSPVHNVTYVTVVEEDTSDDWVTFAAVAGYSGMMVAWGCAVWGSGYYYPPYWGYGGYYPYYYPHYPTYGYGAYYNPWTGAVRPIGRRIRPIRRRWCDRPLQPAHRHLLPGRGGVGTLRCARRSRGLQPTNRRVRADPPGLERVRQLGIDGRAAGRRLGAHRPHDQQPHRPDHACQPGQRRRRGGDAARAAGQRRRCAHRQR